MTAKQGELDLFYGDSLRDAPSFRSERELMSNPFWALSRNPPRGPFERQIPQDDGTVDTIKVSPNEHGRPTVYDRRILDYVFTLMAKRMNDGEHVSRTVRFRINDYLLSIGATPGGREYGLFQKAIERLKGATIYTNIGYGEGKRAMSGFGWLDSYVIHTRETAAGKSIMESVELTVCDWAYNAVVVERRFLVLDKEYFQLSGGLEMMIFSIISRHIGAKQAWHIGLERLYAKTGATSSMKSFVYDLRQMIERDPFSAYSLHLTTDGRMPLQGQIIEPPKGYKGSLYLCVWRKGPMRPVAQIPMRRA